MFKSLFGKKRKQSIEEIIPEISARQKARIEAVQPYTMSGVARLWALTTAIEHLNERGIEGDVAECGVWRGGNILLAKMICEDMGIERNYYLFDTFAGMSAPTGVDISLTGEEAIHRYESTLQDGYADWCYASLEDVRRNFQALGLEESGVKLIKGKVEETLQIEENLPERLVLLRLDTDWYESTLAELKMLYPKLVEGGVLIVDDYGHWQGSRRAVDEFFERVNVLWLRIDYTARMMVK